MKYCTQCHRAGTSMASCGSFATCPGRVAAANALGRHIDGDSQNFPEADPHTVVLLECLSCKAQAAIPLFDIVNQRPGPMVEFRCGKSRQFCEARVIHPVQVVQAFLPEPTLPQAPAAPPALTPRSTPVKTIKASTSKKS